MGQQLKGAEALSTRYGVFSQRARNLWALEPSFEVQSHQHVLALQLGRYSFYTDPKFILAMSSYPRVPVTQNGSA